MMHPHTRFNYDFSYNDKTCKEWYIEFHHQKQSQSVRKDGRIIYYATV